MPGGAANRGLVVRVGDAVVRPIAPCWQATHALLTHLSAAGFDGAPRVLFADGDTEVLTYVEGQAAVPPLPPDTLTDAALLSIADLLRRFHLAAASFDPDGYRWPRPVPARYRAGLVSHNSRQGRALDRFRILLDASGLSRAARRQVAEAVVANHDWTYAIVREAAAAGHPGFADHWRVVAAPAARARRWCQRHRRDLLAAAR
jgi:hypothetical protein